MREGIGHQVGTLPAMALANRTGERAVSDKSGREPGAWIGQRPDQNTEQVRESLDDLAERVAVTNNEADDSGARLDEPSNHRKAADGDWSGQGDREADR